MNFVSLGLWIFLAGLAIAHGEKILSKREANYDAYQEIDCASLHIGPAIRNSMCQPHDRLVDLKPMRGYELKPSKVSVKRCDGNCPTVSSCVPIATRKTEFHVELKSFIEPTTRKCAAVEVEEHVRCRCRCEKMASDCNERQDYDANMCRCQCKEENEKKMECENKPSKRWDRDDCSCRCITMPEYCATGFKWSEAECKCVIY